MKKKILIILILIIIIPSIIYMGLAKYMHYTIEKDIAIEELKVMKTVVNNREVTIDATSKNELVDAISSATFKREFSDATFGDKTTTIFLEDSKNKTTILFKYDANGNGEVTNKATGKKVSIQIKKKLIDKLKKIMPN